MAFIQGVLERMRFCVLIPSYNEEKTIGWIVKTVLEKGYHVVVIDDGSKDKTAKVAAESGAEVIRNECNLGKGAALRRGFGILAQRDYDAVIIMDADGQHLPNDIGPFVDLYLEDNPGVIVGNRMVKPKDMPLVRWITNKIMSLVLSAMCRQNIPDSQCGFRLIDISALRKLSLYTENFEIESEMLLEAAKNGFKIESVPITTVYEGQYSAIHPFKDTMRFFRFVFKKI